MWIKLLGVIFMCLKVACNEVEFKFFKAIHPEQIHLALGNHKDEIVITWNTKDETGKIS